MKTTKILLLGAVVTAFTLSSFAADALLSPRAQGNQIKIVSSTDVTPTTTITYVSGTSALLSPRAAGNQIRVTAGANNDFNPALNCYQNMGGTPRVVTECASHSTMPGCQTMTVAPLK